MQPPRWGDHILSNHNVTNIIMIINKLIPNSMTFSIVLLIIAISFITSGCSPHSGAGNWQADGSNSLKVSRIKVVFEGQADFYIDGQEDSIRRCFWSAIEENVLQMQCVHSDNTDKKETYQFTITQTDQARLTQDDQLIGTFSKQAQ